MIVLILNINVQTELVVRLLMENLVVAHMKVRNFHKETVVPSISGSKSLCTPSRLTSAPLRSDFAVILSNTQKLYQNLDV